MKGDKCEICNNKGEYGLDGKFYCLKHVEGVLMQKDVEMKLEAMREKWKNFGRDYSCPLNK